MTKVQPYKNIRKLVQNWDNPKANYKFILLNNKYKPDSNHRIFNDVKEYEITDPDYKRQPVTNRIKFIEKNAFYIDSDNANFGNEVTLRAAYLVCIKNNELLFYVDIRIHRIQYITTYDKIQYRSIITSDAQSNKENFVLLTPTYGWLYFTQLDSNKQVLIDEN